MTKDKTITKEMEHVLFALEGRPAPGHKIMARVYDESGGQVILPISGLIYALRQMETWELIEKLPGASGLPRYKLTSLGQDTLQNRKEH